MSTFLQLLFSGLTVGAIYGVVALGFTLIYAASDIINFAQGEFVMIGGLGTIFLIALGLPPIIAALVAILLAVVASVLLHRLALQPARGASPVTLIIITMGASLLLRGLAELIVDKQFHGLPSISGDNPIAVLGATILPQSLWVLGGAVAMFGALWLFLSRTMVGKGMLATASNSLAAKLVGIDTDITLGLAFGLSAAIGAIAGILIAPITLMRYDIGAILSLKGFAAVMLGGIGNPIGAVFGGLMLGLLESFTAGLVSSVYKDAVAFIALILVLLVRPQGLMGQRTIERV
ncbi:branched-chain amino acid transport system permease protein [Bradyrhizobium sp. LA6.1]|uniref:branched-chain amino acid ABC transporter permease n=1 Tax=Bradyrhizobium sp. LA6.1 TaxID=3156378 RepID=UPI0033955232